ncbi:hypothetical protein N7474_001953 [Penicillium riverlandense]|uniref:uncharacterized protein n=1 Tax=Penicillium riverlandense TaxID=1903569 RepID=UPI0025483D94|nr:uncharacterized protein N7474_001953 [Penicillium riverlandense]KAJ5833642.1 hypothetical protein N7474_001953 [Penicillium riverlandense]
MRLIESIISPLICLGEPEQHLVKGLWAAVLRGSRVLVRVSRERLLRIVRRPTVPDVFGSQQSHP